MKLIARLKIFFFIAFVIGLSLKSFSQNKKLSASGSLSATTIFYNVNGIPDRKTPFSYILSGNTNISAYGYSIPLSFTISDRNSSFHQPFNQFGLSPQLKWATFHLGYRNIKFAPLVLDGHKILGVGVELHPGKFRIGAVSGRFKKEINIARDVDETLLDSIQQFSRKGYSIKLGYGTKKTFVDLVFLKVSDDTLSLTDYTLENIKSPESNSSLGLNSRIQISKSIHYELSTAYSFYTNNVFSEPIDTDLAFQNFLPPINISTEYFYAINSGLTFKLSERFSMKLAYRRIQPGYKTMGIYFMQNDVENITINSNFSFWKNRVKMNGSLGTERNNLSKLRASTSRRWIGSANMNYIPNKNFGLTANFTNYSLNQQGDEIQIADSVKLYQTNKQLSLVPRYMIFGEKVNHVLMLMYNRSELNDKNPFTSQVTEFKLSNYMLTYSAVFIQTGISLTSTYTYALINMTTSKNKNQSVAIGISKSFLKNKMNLRFNQLISFSNNNNQMATLLRPSISGTYKIADHHQFKARFFLKKNIAEVNPFSETTADMSYLFTF